MSALVAYLVYYGAYALVLGLAALLVVTGVRRFRRRPAAAAPMPVAVASGDGVAELEGDVTLSGVIDFPRGLLVRGRLTLAPDARLTGDVRAEDDVVLGERSSIDGALATSGSLRLASGAMVASADVEKDAVLAPDARVEGALVCERLLLGARAAPAVLEEEAALAPAAV